MVSEKKSLVLCCLLLLPLLLASGCGDKAALADSVELLSADECLEQARVKGGFRGATGVEKDYIRDVLNYDIMKIDVRYDPDGYPTEYSLKKFDATPLVKLQYSYESPGRVREVAFLVADGKIDYRVVHKWNTAGLERSLLFDGKGNLLCSRTCSYTDGKKTGTIVCDADGDVVQTQQFFYNGLGQMVKETRIAFLGKFSDYEALTGTTYWAYDEAGNRVMETRHYPDYSIHHKYVWTYDKAGNMEQETILIPAMKRKTITKMSYTN